MEVVKQSVELVAMTPNPIEVIERCGRVCYKSEGNMKKYVPCSRCSAVCAVQLNGHGEPFPQGSDDCEQCHGQGYKTGAEAFLLSLIARGHKSVLEHASATMLFITDRGMTHEIVRHRICSYSQESTRFCNYGNSDNGIKVIQPTLVRSSGAADDGDYNTSKWKAAMDTCEDAYLELIKNGVAPQHARSVLPTCLKTEIAVTANFSQWRHMIGLRLLDQAGKAHPQIKELFTMVLDHFLNSPARCAFNDLKTY